MPQHFIKTSPYTCPGPYGDYFVSLPDDIKELGNLICGQVIHPITLHTCDPAMFPLYGDLTNYPKYRLRNEDDIFPTAVAMTAELFRLDERLWSEDSFPGAFCILRLKADRRCRPDYRIKVLWGENLDFRQL